MSHRIQAFFENAFPGNCSAFCSVQHKHYTLPYLEPCGKRNMNGDPFLLVFVLFGAEIQAIDVVVRKKKRLNSTPI